MTNSFLLSECCGGAAGVLADEGCTGGEPQERGLGDLRVSARLRPALHLLRDPTRGIVLRQLRGKHYIGIGQSSRTLIIIWIWK